MGLASFFWKNLSREKSLARKAGCVAKPNCGHAAKKRARKAQRMARRATRRALR